MFSSAKLTLLRKFSTNAINLSIKYNAVGGLRLVEQMAAIKSRKMFVAWHPDQDFPYEFTKPIPPEEVIDSGSLIKEDTLNTAMSAFKNKQPKVARQELMNLTYTTKHRWYPRARDKKAKKTPMDRKYL
ncbi:39S ribosomal protein L42, mitochondrial [Condylostylus longicornis]|uniref:39S ribosomal protein L42, mitochondrial n=1 Tax=Condylostylus longicornis TaxID=2530218 RepID=UPI00244DE6F0|nr:39S ribosomal protein L42, mitochondrial [Condylostylus longicornis]